MSKLLKLHNFLTDNQIDSDKLNISTRYEASTEISISHYQLDSDETGIALLRNLKRLFGPLKEAGSEGNKYLEGSTKFGEEKVNFTYYGSFVCERVADRTEPLSESDISWKTREIERLKKELEDGVRKTPVYTCAAAKISVEV